MAPSLLRAVAAALAAHVVAAFLYTLDYGSEGGGTSLGVAERVLYITEGPMYADGQGPFPSGPSEISVEFKGEACQPGRATNVQTTEASDEPAHCHLHRLAQASPSPTTRRRSVSMWS